MKTKPTGVRFEEEKFNLIKRKEGLKTAQAVVTYLVETYWWTHKLNPATKNGPTTEYEAFEGQIKDADELPALELIKWAVIKTQSLSQMDKKVLMATIAEKTSKLNKQ